MQLEEMYFTYASNTQAERAQGAQKSDPVQMSHTHTAYNEKYDEANRLFNYYDKL